MNPNTDKIAVEDNKAEQQYEAHIDGRLAVAEYVLLGDRLLLTHTEVPAELEGRGIAGQLVRYALEDARARHLMVVPRCRFVTAYLKRHPEYLELVDPDFRTAS